MTQLVKHLTLDLRVVEFKPCIGLRAGHEAYLKKYFIHFRERERESKREQERAGEGQREREGDTESKAGSRL